ncbi:homoserine kinase [Magnetovibrio sp. PR-2]|uniref:homoserine kinase n=1 Tax=Magnetovibrio sp. PR-2 TaxID=3120356 RepID=UPI002FCE1933
MAVYTEISDDDLNAFVAQYDIGEVLSCKGIAEGVENSNYLLVTSQAPFILTLYEKRVDPDDLPFFLELTEHLSRAGVPCPTPVRARDGEALRALSERPAAIVTFLNGMWPKRVQNHHCAELGRAMAEMHVAASRFEKGRPNTLSVDNWRPLFVSCDGRGDEVQPGLNAILLAELDALEASWPKDLPQGIIHADLFPDNVFFRGETLSGLIDFYFACTDTFMYDVAICLNAWCFERDGDFNVTKARKMLAAYSKVRPLSGSEMNALPILARGAAMRFLLTRLYDWLNTPDTAFVTRKDPLEYLNKLRFHQRVSGPGAYGLD